MRSKLCMDPQNPGRPSHQDNKYLSSVIQLTNSIGMFYYCCNIQMEEPHLFIPLIKIETRNWTVRITIIEDIPVLTCSTSLKIKCYVLADRETLKS
ncbi:hypothetical protein Leryth_026916 [Lithospermum erythrorhizon]|nr:hypothetical protein Leryth_026916 [Lithospermum erythrorhizon]